MAGLLNIGITGLNAAQAGLNTTAHNITNAGTTGYSRQTVTQTTLPPMFTGVGFFGQGTKISSVQREYSQFLENQVLSADNRLSEFTSYYNQISQIDNLLADSQAGLSPVLQKFFNGVQEVAANPSSVPARQSMISSAQSLASSFQILDSRLSEIRQGVEGEIGAKVDEINIYAKQLAEINRRIVLAQVAGPGVPANDLLDQRNVLVADLNKLIKVNTVEQTDGTINVFIGSGQSLVLGQDASQLAAINDVNDPSRKSIALVAPNGNNILLPERLLTGGELGGLLAFRSGSLDTAQNQLGLVALSLSETFNKQHDLGVDLDGVFGLDFFKAPTPVLQPAIDTSVTVDQNNIGNLTASDYLLYDEGGGNYTLIRMSDKVRVVDNAPLPASVDGLQITPGADPIPATGLLIQPTRFAARNLEVAITDPRKVAAGSPVGVTAPTANEGTGKVSEITVRNITGMDANADGVPDFPATTLQFDAATNAFTLSPAGATVESYNPLTGTWSADLGYNPSTESAGKLFRLTDPSGYQFEFKVSGAPKTFDQFVFSPTTTTNGVGVADNRNAVLLGALQTTKTMLASAGGAATATFQSAYSQIVSAVGNKTREVKVGMESQDVLLTQAKDSRDALSGVNLDEEAANLLRYQQSYQAVAKVMSTAQTLFNELLNIAR